MRTAADRRRVDVRGRHGSDGLAARRDICRGSAEVNLNMAVKSRSLMYNRTERMTHQFGDGDFGFRNYAGQLRLVKLSRILRSQISLPMLPAVFTAKSGYRSAHDTLNEFRIAVT